MDFTIASSTMTQASEFLGIFEPYFTVMILCILPFVVLGIVGKLLK